MLTGSPEDMLVPGDGENALFQEGQGLLASPGFKRLAPELQVQYLRDWAKLGARQESLDAAAIEVTRLLARAENSYRQLEEQACNYVREVAAVKTRVARVETTCVGQVDEGTAAWCERGDYRRGQGRQGHAPG